MKRQVALLIAVFVLASVFGLLAGLVWLPGFRQAVTGSSPASVAQLEDFTAGTFEGVIQQASSALPATWVIESIPVRVLDSTQIFTNGLLAEVGVWAQVDYIKRVDQGVQATSIALQEAPGSALFDRIQAMDGGLWMVGNTQIVITPETVITGTPEVGSLASVHGIRSIEGLRAASVVVMPADNQVAVDGVIREMDGQRWVVDDVIVDVEPGIPVEGDPDPGRHVQVIGVEVAPRQVRAGQVWVREAGDRYALVGWLVGIEGQEFPLLWRVTLLEGPVMRAVYLTVSDDTLVDDSQSPTEPGAWLEINAVRQSATLYRAEQVRVVSRPPKRQFAGTVEQTPAAGLTGEWIVSGYRVVVDDQTAVVGPPQTGSPVWVSGIPDYANVIHAIVLRDLGE